MMPFPLAMKTVVAFFASGASAWVIGTQQTEIHPKLIWQKCTGKGGTSCSNVNGEIVIDANWRWYAYNHDHLATCTEHIQATRQDCEQLHQLLRWQYVEQVTVPV